jgi:hypothetical protein
MSEEHLPSHQLEAMSLYEDEDEVSLFNVFLLFKVRLG